MTNEVPLTWGAQLTRAERILADAGVTAPRLEAVELLCDALGVPSPVLLEQPAVVMDAADAQRYAGWIARRAAGDELPHITGHLEFMGLDLRIGSGDPLPPPGAQRLVETVLEWARHHLSGELHAAELDTGSGAIALALAALEPRFISIWAVDPSATAITAAANNGTRYLLNLIVAWRQGDDLGAVPEPVDLIIWGRAANANSPRFGRLLELAPTKLRASGLLVCGVDTAQAQMTVERMGRAFPDARIWSASPVSGGVVVIAIQLPQPSTGDAAFRTGGNT